MTMGGFPPQSLGGGFGPMPFIITAPQEMQAQLTIKKLSPEGFSTGKEKIIPVTSFPCTISSDKRTPNINVQLAASFQGAIMIVQQMDKLLVRTSPQTALLINRLLPVRPDDWCQLRPGDVITSGVWAIQIDFGMSHKFPVAPTVSPIPMESPAPCPPALPFESLDQYVIESDSEAETRFVSPASLCSSSASTVVETVQSTSTLRDSNTKHPLFDEGFDIDNFLDEEQDLEPDLTDEMRRLTLPSPVLMKAKAKSPRKPIRPTLPKSSVVVEKEIPSSKPAKKQKQKPIGKSVPRQEDRMYLHLKFPGTPDNDTGASRDREEYLPLPVGFKVDPLSDEEEESENMPQSNIQEPVKPKVKETHGAGKTLPKPAPKPVKLAKPATKPAAKPVSKKPVGRPKTKKPESPKEERNADLSPIQTVKKDRKVAPSTPQPVKKDRKVAPSTPQPPKKEKTLRRATEAKASIASPNRSMPSRASRGRLMTDEEKSRLGKESNAELRRMIGEKRS